MPNLKPNVYQKDIFSINYDKLKNDGIRCLVFDLDNTLALISEKRCPLKTKKLIKKVQDEFVIFIISNNKKKRIEPYKKELGVDAVSFAMKPFTRGLTKIRKLYGLKKKEMAMIGDQLVTDVMSGKKFGIKTILVDPLGDKDLKITNLNRKIEEKILSKYQRKGVFERGKYYE